jgi:RNA polymerase sigma-70 factor (ECF subfamily)
VERDQEAFRELIGRHLPRIRRLLAALLGGDTEDMADAEQEILAGLWTGIDRFRFASSFRTWLYRFCRNRAIDLLRREGRHRRRGEAAARAAATAASEDGADPGEGLEREERRQRVREALATLSPDDRLLVVMKDVEDLGIAEISAATGLPEGTVKSRLHRARVKLARRLGEGAAA